MKTFISLSLLILVIVNIAHSGQDAYLPITDNTPIVKEYLSVKDFIHLQEKGHFFAEVSNSNHQKDTISSFDCLLTINPTSMSFPSSAANSTINVMPNDPACQDWNAAANVPWITITEPATGFSSGSNQLIYSITQNTSSTSRTGQIKINNEVFTVTQAGCNIIAKMTSSPDYQSSGGGGLINVTASSSNCSWTVTVSDNTSWITILSGSSGTGNGQVIFSVANYTGTGKRIGTITVANQVFTITQDSSTPPSCTYNITSQATNLSSQASTNNVFTVTTNDSTCPWTVVSMANWLTISSGSTGTGNGVGKFSVSQNTGTTSRSTELKILGTSNSITITQEGTTSCTYNITSQATNLSYQASTNNVFTVTTNDPTCTWTVVSMVNWLTISSGSTGTGNGVGKFSVSQNTGTTSRSTELKILGTSNTITIKQDAKPPEPTCEITLDPSSYTIDYKGGASVFNVSSTLTTCTWTVSTDDDWISISSTSQRGTGNGRVLFTVSQNLSASSRTGKIFVNSQEFTITQDGVSGDSTNLGKAVDNNNLTWTSGGYLPFFVDKQEFYYGDSSAKSGPLPDSQSSWIQTSIKGPGNLSFYWKVSSEAGFDTFKFTVNGMRYSEISGNVEWRRYSMEIPEGNHTLRWTYSKDSAGSSGLDAGWLDKVEYDYTGAIPQKIVPLYRFYNGTSGAHFYTADEREKEEVQQKFPEFTYEGVAYYVYSSREIYTAPVYRFYNTRTMVHFYTIDESEKDTVIRMLPYFNFEGIAFYAFPQKVDYSKPIYRFFNTKTGTHFYTIYESEKDFVIKNYPDWKYEFVSYFAIN